MKTISRYIMTLALLLTAVTGAWATDGVKLTTTEILPPAAWNKDYSGLLPSDMPGLTADGITEEQAKAWADVPKSGSVDLIYGYVEYETYIDYKVVKFNDGVSFLSLTKGESYHGVYLDYNNGTKTYYATGVASSASAVTVDWNKATKTGTFDMPGGNVELEPEYYPQAAFAMSTGETPVELAPTAINDVPATTDGAIVKAGTVANIGTTETAQGTVMYYVSPTALDDAALLALAADQWTADVPTAKSLAQGQAYVYYYVRGNDSDTDEENFSDGDILAANALTVTIAPEPTYAVTFAEGTDPNEWTADPATGVTKGTPVTVTYTGSKKVIGVKAEKKAAAPATVTVTWNNDDITGSGPSFTKDGVTITAGDIDFDEKDFIGGGTFTTTLGNVTKIEVTTSRWQASGEGWSGSTWTGNASSVSFSGEIMDRGEGTTKFVFTIEPTN